MTLVGGDFVASLAGVAAILLAACGLFLAFLDVSRASEPGPLRQRMSGLARHILHLPTKELGRATLRSTSLILQRFVYSWFEQSEGNVVVTGAFTAVVLLAIPLAAIVNTARGGSSFVLLVAIGCIVTFVMLAVLGEMRRAFFLTAILSPALFATMFVFLPGYVLWSLTERMRHMPIGHAALTSLLVAPMLYVASQSAVLGIAGTWGALVPSARATAFRRIATSFAAALPFGYLLLFAALVAGHLAMPDLPQPTDWSILVSGIVAWALSAALTTHFVGERRTSTLRALVKSIAAGAILAYSVAWIAGYTPRFDVIVLSPLFWVVHLPLLPSLALVVLLLLALLARASVTAIARVAGESAALGRPYLASGFVLLVAAGLLGWAAAML
jgi:hypothetical protein